MKGDEARQVDHCACFEPFGGFIPPSMNSDS
jgi:hypothetical protein